MEFERALVWTFQGHFETEDPVLLSVIMKGGEPKSEAGR